MKIVLIISILTAIIYCNGTTINIPEDYNTIQSGINTSADGDTVLVQPGSYLENINFAGKNILVASLYYTTQDTSYISGTVIDGNQSGSVVVINSGETSEAILSGFTVTNGYTATNGAGLYIENSAPCLENLIISNNTANWGGAGIYCDESTVTVTDSWITGNTTSSNGGGINLGYSTLYLDNCLLTDNQANGYGGSAIYGGMSYTYINNCLFRDNYVDGCGGAILVDTNYLIEITDTEICYNTATYYGGGFMPFGCDSVLNRVSMHHNTANIGGAIYDYYSEVVLLNCTIADNQAIETASAIGMEGGNHMMLLNSIVYDNQGTSWFQDVSYIYIHAAYCDIEDYELFDFIEPLEYVIDADPMFMDHPLSDYYLRQNSPCHDSGIDRFIFDINDIEIELEVEEFMGEAPDMGAYEYYEVNEGSLDEITKSGMKLSCYPNPFNPETRICFNLNESQVVDLRIYNLRGELVKVLCEEVLAAGEQNILWNGKDNLEKEVSSGVYLVSIKAGGQIAGSKVVLVK